MFLAGDCGEGSRLCIILAPGGGETSEGRAALDSKRPVILSCWL